MIIYGEYLFFQNFAITLVIMLLTGKLVGAIPSVCRLSVGALLGGVGSFVIFIPMTAVLSLLVRLILGYICILAAFGCSNITKIVAIYYIISIISGGIVMALFLWIQEPVISHQGIFYMENITYLKLFCAGILAFGITYWFIKFVRTKHMQTNFYGRVGIVVDSKTYDFNAFIDSGNSLIEPISGRPVILIDAKGAARLPFRAKDFPERFGFVPYRVVGRNHGNLEALRTDEIIYDRKSIKGVYVAFYEGTFEGYEVLLHRDFLERGLLQNEY